MAGIDALAATPAADPALFLSAGAPSLSAKMGVNTGNIDKTAQDFEAMFATQLLQPMFETVSVDPVFGGGHGEEVMRSFLIQEYGKTIAKSGKLGIASQVKAEMLRAQGGGHTPSSAANAYAKTAAALPSA